MIWTDCDREGEAIGFDIIDVCVRAQSRLDVYRAHFSTLTHADLERAARTLARPNKFLSDAVNVRQEIDLRIGASFTRFQTLALQQIVYQNKKGSVISYGPCQFPTLGFIVERHKQIVDFVEEPFWKIELRYKTKEEEAKFTWARGHLFDKHVVLALYERVEDARVARVTNVNKKPKTKFRPQPLNTVEATKLISRKLRISPEQAMTIMEKLYNRGFLSYPRTETTKYNPTINLKNIVGNLKQSQAFGNFAERVHNGEMW